MATVAGCLVAGGLAAGVWAAFQTHVAAAVPLANWLPRGPLIVIEAKDFAGLLKQWNASPEQAAWLRSDNYAVFSRSRLLGRLQDAQKEFAAVAGLSPDAGFLNEVAGSESVFAWYDIGKLEFVYITHMPSGTAEKTRLLQSHGSFAARQVAGKTFYVRNQSDPKRTVAFAVNGDWLLLATREDLMAGALNLMAAGGGTAGDSPALSVEPWLVQATGAAGKAPGELRMTLNLTRVVPSPYFRSYWVQQNITEMKQFSSSVADLYLEAGDFREERVLLPRAGQDEQPAGGGHLAELVNLLPEHAGVFRAVAGPSAMEAVDSIRERLIEHGFEGAKDARFAPTADLAVTAAGSGGDQAGNLETRIDTAPFVEPAKASEFAGLTAVLTAAAPDALLTVSRTGEAVDGLWVPFQSAVVLRASREWDVAALEGALRQAAQAQLTASGLGLNWKQVKIQGKGKNSGYWELNEARPLEMAVQGRLCILADSPALMNELLAQAAHGSPAKAKGGSRDKAPAQPNADGEATLIAGVDLGSGQTAGQAGERANFARWSALVDGTSSGMRAAKGQGGGQDGAGEPAFFSQNMRSLADAFSQLEGERLVERREGSLTRQTVTYTWKP
jgi:hypothetical protein